LPLFFKEGYKGTFVLLEPITEGLLAMTFLNIYFLKEDIG
jgi:hypothetical protein